MPTKIQISFLALDEEEIRRVLAVLSEAADSVTLELDLAPAEITIS